jgi:FkbM family methyltransferase
MLNPFVYQYLQQNPLHSELEPKIPVNLATQYSQAGEDLIVQSLVYRLNYFLTKNHKQSFNLEDLRYLEIGANHPVATSSTFLFYSRGAKGILVEPNPNLANYLRIARPNDEIYEIACVDDNTTFGDLYLSEASELSSLIVESPNRWKNEFDIKEIMSVSTKHINEVAEYFWNLYGKSTAKYVSIDCEGLDFRLIKALDLEKFPFDIIQIEPGEPLTPGNLENIENHLYQKGYSLIAITEVNAFFVNKLKFKVT